MTVSLKTILPKISEIVLTFVLQEKNGKKKGDANPREVHIAIDVNN